MKIKVIHITEDPHQYQAYIDGTRVNHWCPITKEEQTPDCYSQAYSQAKSEIKNHPWLYSNTI